MSGILDLSRIDDAMASEEIAAPSIFNGRGLTA
jgi:hypothetical protein